MIYTIYTQRATYVLAAHKYASTPGGFHHRDDGDHLLWSRKGNEKCNDQRAVAMAQRVIEPDGSARLGSAWLR